MIVIDATFITRNEFDKLISLKVPIIFIGNKQLLLPVESDFPLLKELLNVNNSHSDNDI